MSITKNVKTPKGFTVSLYHDDGKFSHMEFYQVYCDSPNGKSLYIASGPTLEDAMNTFDNRYSLKLK